MSMSPDHCLHYGPRKLLTACSRVIRDSPSQQVCVLLVALMGNVHPV